MQWQPIPLSKEEQEWIKMFNEVRTQTIHAFKIPAEMIQSAKQQNEGGQEECMTAEDSAWDVLAVLVQTNGIANQGSMTKCIFCGDKFTQPGEWRHTQQCLLWRARALLDIHDEEVYGKHLDKQASDLCHEVQQLKQASTEFIGWIEQTFNHE